MNEVNYEAQESHFNGIGQTIKSQTGAWHALRGGLIKQLIGKMF